MSENIGTAVRAAMQTARRDRTRRALTRAGLLAAAVLLNAACSPPSSPSAAPAAQARAPAVPVVARAVETPPERALVAVATDGADPRHRERAVRALLTNLIDDGDPPRFNDPHWPIVCAETSSVTQDGRPLEGGELVPDGSFTLAFTLDGACPLGDGGPLLFGSVRLLVVRDDEQGLVPVVLAPR